MARRVARLAAGPPVGHWHQCPLCHHTWGCPCTVRPPAGTRPPQPLCPRCGETLAAPDVHPDTHPVREGSPS